MSNQILIVEDESEVRNYLEMALRCQGYTVQCAVDGPDVMGRVAEANGDLSLVLLDLMLPRQDGLDVLRELRRRDTRTPIIVLSGIASPSKVVDAMRCGATDFLAKPVTHEQLTRAVKKATQSGPDPQAHPSVRGAARAGGGLFASRNPRIQAIRAALPQIAVSDVPVVLRGESGVGKEVFAREIHALSPRAGKPFLKINCAALPQELLESELFGYERGAYTGAMKSTPGKFEVADGGVILLDEIGDMDFKLQAKLLHVLQDSEFQRLGGRETVRVDVRVLAATHCDLEKAIQEKRFREDLFYRLNVIGLTIPPLRERQDEIMPLAEFFLQKHAVPGMARPAITPDLRETLLAHPWPGNIRELENVMRKLLVFADAGLVADELRTRARRGTASTASATADGPKPFPLSEAPAEEPVSVLDRVNQARNEAETDAILAALERTRWNRKRAARVLNIDYKGLLYKMKKLGIGPERVPSNSAVSNHRSRPAAAAGGAM